MRGIIGLFCLVAVQARAEEPIIHVRSHPEVEVDPQSGQELTGFVHDENRQPLASRRVISRFSEGLRAITRTALTDAEGRFRFRVPGGSSEFRVELAEDPDYAAAAPVVGPLHATASESAERSEPEEPTRGDGPNRRDPTADGAQSEGSSRALSLFVLPPLITLLFVGAWLGVVPWVRRFRSAGEWFRRRRNPPAAPSGVRERPRNFLGTLGLTASRRVAGRVLDAMTGEAVAAAEVVIARQDAEPIVIRTDDDGSFSAGDLTGASVQIRIARAGYVGERFARGLPHRGELEGVEISLMPVRARLMSELDRAARTWLGAAPPVLTPRELVAHVARGDAPGGVKSALETLGGAVEVACYGRAVPNEELLARLEPLLLQLRSGHTSHVDPASALSDIPPIR